MKSMFLVLTLIAANLMAATEQGSEVVGHVISEHREVLSEKQQVDQRIEALTDSVRDFIVSYDETYGKGQAERFEREWQSKLAENDSSVNDAADKLLLAKISKLKDHQNEGREIAPEELYAACCVYMKYQGELEIKFPSCFVAVLKSETLSKPIFDMLDNVKKSIKRIVKVEPLPVAAAAEKKGM